GGKTEALTKSNQSFKDLEKEHKATLTVNPNLTSKVEVLSKQEKPGRRSKGPRTYRDVFFKNPSNNAFGFKIPKIMRDAKTPITWEAVMLDAALQAELISKKSGMIYPKSGKWPS